MLLSLYVSNLGQLGFIETTLEKLEAFCECLIILGKDLNYVMNNVKERIHQRPPSKLRHNQSNSYTELKKILQKFNFDEVGFTDYSPRFQNYTRTYNLLAIGSLANRLSQADIGLHFWSSHS